MSHIPPIAPIDQATRHSIILEVKRYLALAAELYQQPFDDIAVEFDLKGKTAGMYRVRSQRSFLKSDRYERAIRFNPWLFAKYPEDSWDNTIPHEVAHYVVDCLYGNRTIRPHGQQWQQIMRDFGAQPTTRANYDLSGIPTRQMKQYAYQCNCRQVLLSSQRHARVSKGIQRYMCRDCQSELRYIKMPAQTA